MSALVIPRYPVLCPAYLKADMAGRFMRARPSSFLNTWRRRRSISSCQIHRHDVRSVGASGGGKPSIFLLGLVSVMRAARFGACGKSRRRDWTPGVGALSLCQRRPGAISNYCRSAKTAGAATFRARRFSQCEKAAPTFTPDLWLCLAGRACRRSAAASAVRGAVMSAPPQ
jgi:hypothetical protein